ncbi:MAG: hypothetical protein JOS17DRAFT_781028 [Linnemannia elongata]|nr:MAG: hypothetical protein JOS17DRAFT_781028 [Linnemannia elongata]
MSLHTSYSLQSIIPKATIFRKPLPGNLLGFMTQLQISLCPDIRYSHQRLLHKNKYLATTAILATFAAAVLRLVGRQSRGIGAGLIQGVESQFSQKETVDRVE